MLHLSQRTLNQICIFSSKSKYLPEEEGSVSLFVSFFLSLSPFALRSKAEMVWHQTCQRFSESRWWLLALPVTTFILDFNHAQVESQGVLHTWWSTWIHTVDINWNIVTLLDKKNIWRFNTNKIKQLLLVFLAVCQSCRVLVLMQTRLPFSSISALKDSLLLDGNCVFLLYVMTF